MLLGDLVNDEFIHLFDCKFLFIGSEFENLTGLLILNAQVYVLFKFISEVGNLFLQTLTLVVIVVVLLQVLFALQHVWSSFNLDALLFEHSRLLSGLRIFKLNYNFWPTILILMNHS